MNSYTIYGILNHVTRRWYVGQTNSYKTRKQNHLTSLRNKIHINPKLQHDFDKYGESAFKFMVLAECDNLDESLQLECQFISHYNSFYDGYNQTTGGDNREFHFTPCEWNGVQYESIGHAAKALDVGYSAMQYRVAQGYKSDADLKGKKAITWNSVDYSSVTEAALANGYSSGLLAEYVRKGFASDEDVRKPRPKKKPIYVRPEFIPNAVKATWNGIEYESIGLAAKANNIPQTTMNRYIRKGYIQDSDVPPATRIVIWNDITYPTLNEAANAIGVTRKTMRTYLEKGYARDSDLQRRNHDN